MSSQLPIILQSGIDPEIMSCTSVEMSGDEDTWTIPIHKALAESNSLYRGIYNAIGGSNDSSESLDDVSYTETPHRVRKEVVETNASGGKRIVYVKYRPLRKWMETKGPKGLLLRAVSHLQIAGHWGITIGPYTYDIYQRNGQVIMHTGDWCIKDPNERQRVSVKEIGCTYDTDLQIAEKAKLLYARMKPEGYDKEFNNCHRFVYELAEDITPHGDKQSIKVRLRLLYIWNLLPASHLFQTVEWTNQLLRLPKQVLLKILAEISTQGHSSSEIWCTIKRNFKVHSPVLLFLLTTGPIMVFLNMTRYWTGWNPHTIEGRAQYLKLFDIINIPDHLVDGYLKCSFNGPQALKSIGDKLIELSATGSKGVLKRLAQ